MLSSYFFTRAGDYQLKDLFKDLHEHYLARYKDSGRVPLTEAQAFYGLIDFLFENLKRQADHAQLLQLLALISAVKATDKGATEGEIAKLRDLIISQAPINP